MLTMPGLNCAIMRIMSGFSMARSISGFCIVCLIIGMELIICPS